MLASLRFGCDWSNVCSQFRSFGVKSEEASVPGVRF